MTYTLHYISANGPGPSARWSVWREEYHHVDDDEPIADRTVWVSGHDTEDEAFAEANRLQAGVNQ